MGCPFCDILDGTAPAELVMEWRDAIAIRPLKPTTLGHTLIIPRQHVRDAAAQPQVAALTMERAATVAAHHGSANIITSIGAPATQTVWHLHLHVVPRVDGDGLTLAWTGQT